jgi:hypothetical protein
MGGRLLNPSSSIKTMVRPSFGLYLNLRQRCSSLPPYLDLALFPLRRASHGSHRTLTAAWCGTPDPRASLQVLLDMPSCPRRKRGSRLARRGSCRGPFAALLEFAPPNRPTAHRPPIPPIAELPPPGGCLDAAARPPPDDAFLASENLVVLRLVPQFPMPRQDDRNPTCHYIIHKSVFRGIVRHLNISARAKIVLVVRASLAEDRISIRYQIAGLLSLFKNPRPSLSRMPGLGGALRLGWRQNRS